MNYYVIASDGQKYGPADVNTLNQWIREGRLYPQTMLEPEGEAALPAANVPGLIFPVAQPIQTPNPGNATQGGIPGPGGPYGQPPQGNYVGYQRYSPVDDGSSDITKAWIFGSIGLLCCPIVFSVAGIVFANKAIQKGHRNGQAALIFCIVTLVIGVVFGASSGFRALSHLH